jgi:hypothetical protein
VTFDWNGEFLCDLSTFCDHVYLQPERAKRLNPDRHRNDDAEGPDFAGKHSVVEIFLTRTGYLTIPKPSRKRQRERRAVHPDHKHGDWSGKCVARWFGFTTADGGKYFVIPVPPRDPSGQFAIGTSTVIPDNVTNSAIFDFTDEALMASLAIDIPGNNLFRQQVLGRVWDSSTTASGFFVGRAKQGATIPNMGFEGGYIASRTEYSAWMERYRHRWRPYCRGLWPRMAGSTATISQTAYQNQNGTAIIEPNTRYTYRVWVNGTSIATLSSATTGFTATASVSAQGTFVQANFSLQHACN